MRPVHIIGVSLDLGGNRRGVDMGPSAFRIAGIAERLTALGVPVVDTGDVVGPIPEIKQLGDPRKKYIREISRVCEKLYRTSLNALEKGAMPLVLGGDHSLAAGSVAATSEFARREGSSIGLIWVDAHGDMNTPASSAARIAVVLRSSRIGLTSTRSSARSSPESATISISMWASR